MRLKLSQEQFDLYCIINKKLDHTKYLACQSHNLSQNDHMDVYLPNNPIPRFDGGYKAISREAFTLSERKLYATREEAEERLRLFDSNYRYEVVPIPINKRIELPDGNTNYSYEKMMLLDMTRSVPSIMAINTYFGLMSDLHFPFWIDVEQYTKGNYIVIPKIVFEQQFSVQFKPEFLYLADSPGLVVDGLKKVTLDIC